MTTTTCNNNGSIGGWPTANPSYPYQPYTQQPYQYQYTYQPYQYQYVPCQYYYQWAPPPPALSERDLAAIAIAMARCKEHAGRDPLAIDWVAMFEEAYKAADAMLAARAKKEAQ